jgi:hypothetical protein
LEGEGALYCELVATYFPTQMTLRFNTEGPITEHKLVIVVCKYHDIRRDRNVDLYPSSTSTLTISTNIVTVSPDSTTPINITATPSYSVSNPTYSLADISSPYFTQPEKVGNIYRVFIKNGIIPGAYPLKLHEATSPGYDSNTVTIMVATIRIYSRNINDNNKTLILSKDSSNTNEYQFQAYQDVTLLEGGT